MSVSGRADTISPAEAAERLGIQESTLRRYVQKRKMPHTRIGKRVLRFTEQNLQDYLDMQAVPANSMELTDRSQRAGA